MPNSRNGASKKRSEEEEVEQTHREQERSEPERREQQNLNQGFNTGTTDVQHVSDWGSTRRTKKRKK